MSEAKEFSVKIFYLSFASYVLMFYQLKNENHEIENSISSCTPDYRTPACVSQRAQR